MLYKRNMKNGKASEIHRFNEFGESVVSMEALMQKNQELERQVEVLKRLLKKRQTPDVNEASEEQTTRH
jgi:hypothetical protein